MPLDTVMRIENEFSSHLAFAIPLVIIYLLQETGSII